MSLSSLSQPRQIAVALRAAMIMQRNAGQNAVHAVVRQVQGGHGCFHSPWRLVRRTGAVLVFHTVPRHDVLHRGLAEGDTWVSCLWCR